MFTVSKSSCFKQLILASSSPRRKEILMEKGGLEHLMIIPSTFEEENKGQFSHMNILEYTTHIAEGKVLQVAKAAKEKTNPELYKSTLFIGADTVLLMDGIKYEKPTDKEDAFNMLKGFTGKQHQVCTAVVLVISKEFSTKPTAVPGSDFYIHKFTETSVVEFGDISDDHLRSYIDTGEPMDKAGGYGIQGLGAQLIKGVQGDYYNVMGFPLYRFCRELESFIETLV